MGRRDLGAIAFVAVIVAVVLACLFSPLGDWLTIEQLRESRLWLAQRIATRPFLCATAFFLLCVGATAVCFPAAPVLGVAGGALFGLWTGLAIVLVASSIGSTASFLASRHLLRDRTKRTFGRRIASIDRGIAAYGGAYLLAVRFNPVIPYWLVNLTMGITAMRFGTYVALTPIGLLPATLIYVSAGTQLALIRHVGDVASPSLILGLLLFSLFPLFAAAAGVIGRPSKA